MSGISIRQTISNALDRKKVPAFIAGDLGDLATKLGLARPVSLANLIQVLNNLPPAVVTINIDQISTPGQVTASGQVGVQSDGAASFRGTVTNPHAGEGINYLYAVALLDVKDSSGNVLVFYESGNLYNLFESSSTTFQQDGFSQFIAENWDAAKKSRYHAIIEVSDNVFDDIASAIAYALGFVAANAILFLVPGGDGPDYSCEWGPDAAGREDTGHGIMRGCYRLK